LDVLSKGKQSTG